LKKPSFTTEQPSRNVSVVRVPVAGKEWEQWFLLQADEHWDNPHCQLKMLKRHHEEAVIRGAGILKFGDTFCAMQGKYDKRSDKSCLRPEHQHGDYIDRLVKTATDWYEPYAKHIVMFGDGNHEKSIKQRHETDLLERLTASLNDRTGACVHHGGYGGWVRFMFTRGNQRQSVRLWYFHGAGGGGPVTKDFIQANRRSVFVGNADIMVTGHTHDMTSDTYVKTWLNDANEVEHRSVKVVKCPTYKEEYGDGSGGWHVETGKPPKPIGAWWLRFHIKDEKVVYSLHEAD